MIDRAGGRRVYQTIAWEIRDKIAKGELRPGDSIPSLPAIQRDYDVSNQTAQGAVRLLKRWGLVRSESGSGTYVLEVRPIVNAMTEMTIPDKQGNRRTWREIAADYGMAGSQRATGAGRAAAPVDVADAFGYEADTEVAWRQRLLLIDDHGVQIATSYYPRFVVDAIPSLVEAERLRTNAMELMAQAGFAIAGGTDLVFARAIERDEAELLDVEAGAPVTEVFRVASDTEDRIVTVERMVSDSARLRQQWAF